MKGPESGKTYADKLNSGFFDRYMGGECGIEIGNGAAYDTILPGCTSYDLGTPGYDGIHIPHDAETFNWLYSSHCLEHIEDYVSALQEWFRVVKRQGHLIIIVPHRDLYEKKLTLPSRFNGDHKRFYTPARLLNELEYALPTNSFRVRRLQDNDQGHVYSDPPEVHGRWLYEIELVVQKL